MALLFHVADGHILLQVGLLFIGGVALLEDLGDLLEELKR